MRSQGLCFLVFALTFENDTYQGFLTVSVLAISHVKLKAPGGPKGLL